MAGWVRITVRTKRPVRGSARTTDTAGAPAPCNTTAAKPHMEAIIKHFRTVLFQSFSKNTPSRATVAVTVNVIISL
jgi:hypothetical protein